MDFIKLALLAMDNAKEGITISDATLPDNPLILVNKGFLKMTGYSFEEAIGKNCRYLQGEKTSAKTVKVIKTALHNRTLVEVELINYRKNGEPFWNRVRITPVYNERKELIHFIGIQEDITEIKQQRLTMGNEAVEKIVAGTVLKAQKNERHRVGMELHDNIGQKLSAIKIYMGMLHSGSNNKVDLLKKSGELLNETIGEVRDLSKNLVSVGMDKNNLMDVLDKLIGSTQTVVDFDLHFNSEGFSPDLLSCTEQLVIFRVIQEQLNNIIKHSKAIDVIIDLITINNKCKLHIKDNGIGFNTASVPVGIGIRNIRSRVEALKGSMELISVPKKGTELVVEFDLMAQ
jgi:PAS domain S-box-containing protein